MTGKEVKEYGVADITSEDNRVITELEGLLSSRANKDIVLVAYETKNIGNLDERVES